MNSDQKRVYELLKHPMSLDVAYERSDFRNRYHFTQIVQSMVSQGILEENQKKNNDVDTITVISRAKKISPAKLAAGAAAMFVWFYVVPTVVFIIGG